MMQPREGAKLQVRVHPLIRTLEAKNLASLPSVLEFHQVNRRVFVLEMRTRRLRLADYNRRFGIPPTPEHVVQKLDLPCGEVTYYLYPQRRGVANIPCRHVTSRSGR
ncbi:hypothetical protein SAMN06295879_1727 [Agreia bicolorata]|uniref:Uncharacterized protein n=1 Tax=Agreia bicolorata TaxID=110935 RepID=A0A1T4XVE9_9MICO|nr:hypothetical protein SAMN06295879_1727 [Agreia bicolorata]